MNMEDAISLAHAQAENFVNNPPLSYDVIERWKEREAARLAERIGRQGTVAEAAPWRRAAEIEDDDPFIYED